MNIRLYLDEDTMDGDLVSVLRARGIDVQTAFEAGMIGREDDEHLAHATAEGRALYSFNRGHFCRLLRLIARVSAEEMQNRIEFLSDWGDER